MKPAWLKIAENEIGVAEILGEKDNPRIIEYHSVTTLKATDDETAWCSSFVSWCLERSGVTSTKSAAARSYMAWGKRLDKPYYGCIVVLKRGLSQTSGHVGFFIAETERHLIVLGGNQSNSVTVQAFLKHNLLCYTGPADFINSEGNLP
jgi:uncharacterized protein (TIGR02594 family)